MKVLLSDEDRKAFEGLNDIRRLNFRILHYYSLLLNNNSSFITSDMINDMVTSCHISECDAYCALLGALFGLDEEKNPDDALLMRRYIRPSVMKTDRCLCENDAYFTHISFDTGSAGAWDILKESYAPYEAFIYDDYLVLEDYTEIPRLGFFDREFRFPAVRENKREWMSVTPNEINTLRQGICDARGNALTFGLGLGYFVYMASRKKEVNTVTVVEKDENVIRLFKEEILPQFENRDKVRIIHDDAFFFAEHEMKNRAFDTAYADTWHDTGDGPEMYLRFKKAERLSSGTKWGYWIETSLLSRLRWLMFDTLCAALYDGTDKEYGNLKTIRSIQQVKDMLSDEFLKKAAGDILCRKDEI